MTAREALAGRPSGLARLFPVPLERGQVDMPRVVWWRKLAEVVADYGTKGRLVGVDGRLQGRSYEDGQGIRRTAVEVVAGSVSFLDRRRQVTAEDAEEADSEADVS